MNQFDSIREAMEFVAGEVVKEARRQGVPLSDIERKMLYFSETDWTLEDMPHVADVFHREYEDVQYEQKMRRLIKSARKQASKEARARWSDAIRLLSQGDRYLLLMVDPIRAGRGWDHLRLVAVALSLVFAAIVVLEALEWYIGHHLTRDEYNFYGWAAALSLGGLYLLLRLLFGSALDRFISRIIDAVFGDAR